MTRSLLPPAGPTRPTTAVSIAGVMYWAHLAVVQRDPRCELNERARRISSIDAGIISFIHCGHSLDTRFTRQARRLFFVS